MILRALIVAGAIVGAPGVLAHEPDLKHLPLGDGKLSNQPRAGWIWACPLPPLGGGAVVNGPWIKADGTYDLTEKLVVQGAVTWPHHFMMSIENGARVFTSNDLPDHPTGIFPVPQDDPAYRVDRNPNHIAAQQLLFTLPLNPTVAAQPQCAPGGVGIMLTGVALYSAIDAQGRDAVAHEVQDSCRGHPQLRNTYHYHSITPCLGDKTLPGGHSALVGYAIDGFGIFGPRGEGGKILSSADLDECHGHTHAIPWNGKMVVMYHYHGTSDFPYTVGCLRGHYDPEISRILAGGPPSGGLPRRPRVDISVAAQRLGIPVERLMEALGPPPPDIAGAAEKLGIGADTLREALGLTPR
jgi:hypothetical protein